MRIICMETLIEIGILNIRLLVQSNALRTVLVALKDGPFELGPAITGMLLYLANSPSTRRYLIPGADLEMVLVGEGTRNVHMLLSSWTGLIYLCMSDNRAIRSLISTLFAPASESDKAKGTQDAILDLIISSLHIKTPAFTNAFLEGKRLTGECRVNHLTKFTIAPKMQLPNTTPRPAS
jgi:hypothetical protein